MKDESPLSDKQFTDTMDSDTPTPPSPPKPKTVTVVDETAPEKSDAPSSLFGDVPLQTEPQPPEPLLNSHWQPIFDTLNPENDEYDLMGSIAELNSQLTLMNEDTTNGFKSDLFIPALTQLMEHYNAELCLIACQCLFNLLEALPNSSTLFIKQLPILCNKLLNLEYPDLGEQVHNVCNKLFPY